MAFVKLDCGILNSTLWVDREARELFVTALLMATPLELQKPTPQLEVRSLKETGFVVPPGWYGFVPAAGTGIIRIAGIDGESGMAALERLGSPDQESRTPDFDGRRLVRVDGGYIALNYDKYRQKDHTAAERTRRYRARKRHAVTVNVSRVTDRSVTQAEAEADKESAARSLGAPAREVLPLDAIQAKVNSLRPEWQKMPHWTYAEQSDLLGAAAALESLDAESWRILADYLRARLPQGCPGWQPRSRRKFLEAPGDVLNYAIEWHRKQRRPATRPVPEPETPLTPEQRAELLAELKSKP